MRNDAWRIVATGRLDRSSMMLTTPNGARYRCHRDEIDVHARGAIPTVDCDWQESWGDTPTRVTVWVCPLSTGDPHDLELGTYAAGPVVFADPPIELLGAELAGGDTRSIVAAGYRFADPARVPDRVFTRACPN